MAGLLFYMQEAGSPRALLLILLWIGLLVLDWTLMRRGVAKRSPRLRYAAYGTTALSIAAAAVVHRIFTTVETGPANYAPGYWDPVWETLPSGCAAVVSGLLARRLLEHLADLLEQAADFQVLGADCLALAAGNAVGRLAMAVGIHLVIEIAVPVLILLFGVETGEQVGDLDLPGAAGHAVAAVGAGDRVLPLQDAAHPGDGGLFRAVERGEGLHVIEVVLHLGQVAHAAENHCCGLSTKPLLPITFSNLIENHAAAGCIPNSILSLDQQSAACP